MVTTCLLKAPRCSVHLLMCPSSTTFPQRSRRQGQRWGKVLSMSLIRKGAKGQKKSGRVGFCFIRLLMSLICGVRLIFISSSLLTFHTHLLLTSLLVQNSEQAARLSGKFYVIVPSSLPPALPPTDPELSSSGPSSLSIKLKPGPTHFFSFRNWVS